MVKVGEGSRLGVKVGGQGRGQGFGGQGRGPGQDRGRGHGWGVKVWGGVKV